MGQLYEFEPEKLIIGVIYNDRDVFGKVMNILEKKFGEYDDMCEEFSFSDDFSTYYDSELGGKGLRRIYSFKQLVSPDEQADIKEFTNSIEFEFSIDGNRKINLDPGLLNHGRLLLATTKPLGFRIPLKNGIHTELTLFYARGEWHKLPWTYRDYQSKKVQEFLLRVRKKFISQRKELILPNKKLLLKDEDKNETI